MRGRYRRGESPQKTLIVEKNSGKNPDTESSKTQEKITRSVIIGKMQKDRVP